ncbi:Crp/Fnr family transcriptional regulator [Psychromonas sp. KJ10-10]|uniref:Crp/Fnr family transcriptional regulator n=1 Tax=Psychromonas sp. KJ10-10 TaxID=3391823 RepID=UPI0039B43E62
MLKNDAETLSTSPLFNGISTEEIIKIFNSTPFIIKSHPLGSLIMHRGDEYDSLRILLEGEVSAEIQDATGKTIKIENLQSPDALALGVLFAEDNTIPVTVVAQTDIRLISISKESIIAIAQTNKQFLSNYFTQSGNKVVFLVEKLRLLKFSSLKQKFSGYILNLSEKQKSNTVKLPYNREELAELFGVARPSLSRICSEMSDQGVLSIDGKTISILNSEALKNSLS